MPQAVRDNKMHPKSELMIYIGIAPEKHGNIFMRSLGNIVFTAAYAIFDETLFLCCQNKIRQPQALNKPNKTSLPLPILSSGPDNDKDLNTCQPPPISLKRNNRNGTTGDDQQVHRPIQPLCHPPSIWEKEQQQGEIISPRHNPPRVQTVLRRPGNIYGENKHPIDQLKLGKKSRRAKSQECTHRDENMATEDKRLVPGLSHVH